MEIKSNRIKCGMTQEQLAEKVGVRQAAVAHWEAGIRNPSVTLLPTIAEALGCEIADLFGSQKKEVTG